MKPGQMRASTATLPMRRPSAISVAMTSGAVATGLSMRTTSSSRITFAGLKKCAPTTSCGRRVTAAISAMSSPEVLVARMAPGLAMASSSRNRRCLSAMSSNTASMKRSAPSGPPASARLVVPRMRAMRSATASGVSLPRWTLVS